jgi:hypothetical protein
MPNMPDAFQYGKEAGIIVCLVCLVVALINRKEFNRHLFSLTVALTAILSAVLLFYVVRDATGQRATSQKPAEAPVIGNPPRSTPVAPAPQPPKPSMLEVRGRVSPNPKPPAFVSIDGTDGRWPIDNTGSFSFKIPPRNRNVTLAVVDGEGRSQSGFYYLSDTPLTIAFNPAR